MAEAQISKGAEAAAKGSDQISLTCSTEYSSYPLSEQTCWAVTSFKAPFYEPTARASVDIVAVIDKSGSMRGQKLSLVKDTLHFVIDQCKSYYSYLKMPSIVAPASSACTSTSPTSHCCCVVVLCT